MSSSAAWQSWRTTFLPIVESSIGRTQVPTSRCHARIQASRQCFRAVRHVSFTPVRRDAQSHSKVLSEDRKDLQDRKSELDLSGIEQYPRASHDLANSSSLQQFAERYQHLKNDEVKAKESITLRGRIMSIRKSGGKLAFIDLVEDPGQHRVQVMLNLGHLALCGRDEFRERVKLIRRGDFISVLGSPTRTSRGELSLLASDLPTVLSPCLHVIPLTSNESGSGELLDRHVQMLSDSSLTKVLAARSQLIRTMRRFFEDDGFYEVQTPILAAAAGGAAARPFETTATEFQEKKLTLRIAPELWLKRLIVGGMPRVFEIGPSFRNEGLDRTHNPEFTTCEFYAAYHNLAALQQKTEQLLRQISKVLSGFISDGPPQSLFAGDESGEFTRIDFIPAINAQLKSPLPNLASPSARNDVLEVFKSHNIPIPPTPTLPRLLDKLCSHYLEPSCESPTWIINIPECLSPLAKSFIHPTAANSQPVAARAELFINQREVVNCYEEENSPFEQRRKFIDQQRLARLSTTAAEINADGSQDLELEDDEAMKIDEDYLRALEWGLPPTGGWGCGVDRLVMLFTGKDRISDVLSFGSLRAVTRGAEKWHNTSLDNEKLEVKDGVKQ